MNRTQRLEAAYARIPRMIGCDGSCWRSCGPVVQGGMLTPFEASRIADVPRIEREDDPTICELLSEDHRCTAYDRRPFICRAWGTMPSMACPHRCVPERVLSDEEALEIRREVILASGGAEEFAFGDATRELLRVVRANRDRH